MLDNATRREATWSVSEASARLDVLLDASAEGTEQIIERNGFKFIVTLQSSETGNAKEHLLAGGPLEDGDLAD